VAAHRAAVSPVALALEKLSASILPARLEGVTGPHIAYDASALLENALKEIHIPRLNGKLIAAGLRRNR